MNFFEDIGFMKLLAFLVGIYILSDLVKISRQLFNNHKLYVAAALIGLFFSLYFTSVWPFFIAVALALGNGAIDLFKRRVVKRQELEAAQHREYLIGRAEKGPEEETIRIAKQFLNSYSLEKDEEEGIRLLLHIAETGSAKAQQELICLHANQCGKIETYDSAVRRFRLLAVDWDAEDLENLANKFELGWNVPKIDAEASRWYRLARERFREQAEDGDANAANKLGEFLHYGRGGAKDDLEALKWSLVAAKQGIANAQERVGFIYCFSEIVPRGYSEAVYWLRRAAEKGESLSKAYLILLYDSKIANPEDYAEDVKLYGQELELALQNGEKPIEWSFLASGYECGWFGVTDHDKAIYWLCLASDFGDAHASIWLGDKYAEGRGIPRDLLEARRLYRVAAEQGSSEGLEKITNLEAELRNEVAAA